MSISSDTYWEARASGYDINGGGFSASNSGSTGIDYSQRHEPYSTYGTLSGAGTTTLSCSSPDAFDATVRGNVIFISGQGRYCITAFNNSTSVTVDRSLGNFSAVSGAVGGAVKSPGDLTGTMVSANICWCQSGVFRLAGNSMSFPSNTSIIGYGVLRGDAGLAYFECSGMNTSQGCFVIADHALLKNVVIANSKGVAINGSNQQSTAINSYVINAADAAFTNIQGCVNCYASGNLVGFSTYYAIGCVAVANQNYGFNVRHAIYCFAYNNSRSSNNSYPGFQLNTEGGSIISCVSDGNSRQNHGFTITNKSAIVNCIASNNNSYGISFGFTTANTQEFAGAYSNACYSNSAGNFNNLSFLATGVFNLTANPFTNIGGLDFSLNSVNGGGSFIKESGYGNRLPGLNTLGFMDIGPIQSRSSGNGGIISTQNFFSMIPNFNGGFF